MDGSNRGRGDLTACVVPESLLSRARMQWRLGGDVVSSRRAEAILSGASSDEAAGEVARETIVQRLASLTGQDPADIRLFPSGMAAFSATHRAVTSLDPRRATIQFEFPYVDALKIQQEAGNGVIFIANPNDLAAVTQAVSERRVAAVFCEIASNPQLRTADLAGLSAPVAQRGHSPGCR